MRNSVTVMGWAHAARASVKVWTKFASCRSAPGVDRVAARWRYASEAASACGLAFSTLSDEPTPTATTSRLPGFGHSSSVRADATQARAWSRFQGVCPGDRLAL